MSAASHFGSKRRTGRLVPVETIARLCGFGFTACADGYLFQPTAAEEIREVLDLARKLGRQVTLRGAGLSYGDANIGAECIVIDISRMNRILSWEPQSGIVDCEAGVTIENLWRRCLPDGFWPPVVSGTMFPTLAGALGMNIHGKNNPHEGTLGEHVLEIEVLLASGSLVVLTPADELFFAVIGGFGMLGAITRVKLRLRRVPSGDLRVLPLCLTNWDAQFEAFESLENSADYMVSWIDCFARGGQAGRGQFHAAWYAEEGQGAASTLTHRHQDLPDKMLGLIPKSLAWRALKVFCNRPGMRFLNWAKHVSAKAQGSGKPYPQSLVAFSFLLDYVPNWRNAYLPDGFIQYQSFVPKEHARRVFSEQITLLQQARLESFLSVMKRHRPDRFLFSHAVDGYSLALDLKVTQRNRHRLFELCHRMNDLVLESGGRFYFAKDSTLRPQDVSAFMGEQALGRYRRMKKELDPDSLFTSELARRLGLG